MAPRQRVVHVTLEERSTCHPEGRRGSHNAGTRSPKNGVYRTPVAAVEYQERGLRPRVCDDLGEASGAEQHY